MGRNLPAKKYTKRNPTVRRLSFECSGSDTKFIDVGLALSAINQKHYRSGLYYYINSVEVYNNETGCVNLLTLPDHYTIRNSWRYAFEKYMEMCRQTDMPRPKWHDFVVYMSDRHRQAGTLIPNLHDVNDSEQAIARMEPDALTYSQFTSADVNDSDGDADNFHVHMIGPHVGTAANWTSIGAVVSWDAVTKRVQSPDPVLAPDVATDPLTNLFDFSTEESVNEIIERLDEAQDEAPYNVNVRIGEGAKHMQQVARIGTEVGVGRIGRAGGFCAPLGLICVDPFGVSTDFRVVLNLAVGTYHGVHAERVF